MRIRTAQEVGLLVRDERRAQALTQEELARRIGATRQWVRSLEAGKPRLELGLTLRALTALGIIVNVNARSLPSPSDALPGHASQRSVG